MPHDAPLVHTAVEAGRRSSDAGAGSDRYRALVLVVVCLASYLVVSDVAMVNVAVPSISDGAGLTSTEVHWFVSSYALAFAAVPLLAGRVADRFGHVRVFAIGLAVFSTAAVVAGWATGPAVLLGARAVQGVGGAVLAATTLGLLTVTFRDPSGRRRAFAVWSATVSGGAAAGVLLGGVLTAGPGWRSVFLLDAAIALLCLLLIAAVARSGVRTGRARRLDLVGGALVTVALALLVAGLSESTAHGWRPALTWGLAGGALVAVIAFVVHESRTADPLLPVQLLRRPGRVATYAVTAVVGAVLYFMYLAISVYLQRVQGSGPLLAGVQSLPAALSVVTGALASTWIARRVGPRQQLTASLCVVAVGFAWLGQLTAGGAYWTNLGLPLVVVGLGLGTSFVPATVLATDGVAGHDAGIASGLVNSSRQLGRAVGLAALSGLAVPASHATTASTIAGGDSLAFRVCAGAALVGAAVAITAIPGRRRGSADDRSAVVDTADVDSQPAPT